MIKALPQLQKLDNVQVGQDELKEAQRKGRTLTHPEDGQESEEEYVPQQPQQQQQQYNRYQDYSECEYSPVQRSPPRQEVSVTKCLVVSVVLLSALTELTKTTFIHISPTMKSKKAKMFTHAKKSRKKVKTTRPPDR